MTAALLLQEPQLDRVLRGKILRYLRIKAELDQAELSEESGLLQGTISKMERGEMTLTADHMDVLVEPLGVLREAFSTEPNDLAEVLASEPTKRGRPGKGTRKSKKPAPLDDDPE